LLLLDAVLAPSLLAEFVGQAQELQRRHDAMSRLEVHNLHIAQGFRFGQSSHDQGFGSDDGRHSARFLRGVRMLDHANVRRKAGPSVLGFVIRLDRHVFLDPGPQTDWQQRLQLIAGVGCQAGMHIAPMHFQPGVHAGKRILGHSCLRNAHGPIRSMPPPF
jgi:hypothetical protein